MTLKEISLIFSYINRIEYKIDYDKLNYLQRKGKFEIVNDNNGIMLIMVIKICLIMIILITKWIIQILIDLILICQIQKK